LKKTWVYTIRTFFIYISFLVFQHVSFSGALFSKGENKRILETIPVRDLFLLSLSNLISIWYKFLCIWRIFRLWALWDGVETVENMPQCMCNNASF
jgi:protein-cysteine N-palmitoyltransferase HHAT